MTDGLQAAVRGCISASVVSGPARRVASARRAAPRSRASAVKVVAFRYYTQSHLGGYDDYYFFLHICLHFVLHCQFLL